MCRYCLDIFDDKTAWTGGNSWIEIKHPRFNGNILAVSALVTDILLSKKNYISTVTVDKKVCLYKKN